METFDLTDMKILRALQDDARLNTKEIAHKIGLSVTPTYERLKKIERSGVIRQYVTLLDAEKIGKALTVFCNVSLQLHSQKLIRQFETAIRKMEEVMECYHLAGTYDYMLKVAVADMKSYQYFLTNKLAAVENIAQVHSSFVMTPVKYTTSYPLDLSS
ncbi:Lrp/AsnC family transcriptional regulator, leucine-responsive regulatory protein [Chitinophaga terrae (ex Kim and Jung 2007)]|jgi:DNA-binding Lrp family transcriptional regulator|uniref:Lrp/AsnC family transcriptional regulator, leucine-responsive regulatory protein n=1 Tax=Chitinophaga terrae (ex Kim and Jung 2007) TaxID=408074 RepID=A0A1H4F5N7_9BACT|nr:Lrp/AsnC family transcriptional regulator [Chitinophaga terrae (ex Kim and Jung 2007)]MDQ0106482.1 DNA-binding Lrp family transcriptional regulator [Chitinophaga terrae (ex Kim and Jung 2007)]GEP92033.1 AsnC family transcriptional regulator [Chitinophaga terrae (ex Kim and Jung 2007)]SEA91792.1 Lrp/AsnC family transcriptional regulator, leucine-responsive regulatory protein [Chitinophaga terrae (ex Kim and Jung 2007)]